MHIDMKTIKKNITNNITLKETGKKYLDNRDYDLAITCLTDYLNKESNDTDALNWLGQIFRDKNEFEKAKIYFQKALSLNAKDEFALYGLSDVLKEEGNYDEALRLTRKVLSLNKYNGWAHYNLGFILSIRQDYEQAEKEYRIALKIMPHNISVYNNLALVLAKQGKIDECIQICKEALNINGNAIEIKKICSYLLENERFKEVKELIQKFFAKYPQDISLLKQLVDIYCHLKDYQNAIQIYEQLIEIDPRNTLLIKGLADLYNLQKQFDKAVLLYEKFVEENSDNPEALKSLADIYSNQRLYKKAIVLYRKILDIEPDNTKVLVSLGHIYRDQKKDDMALFCYSKVVEIDINSYEAHFGMGRIFLDNNQFLKAEEKFKEALKYNPNDINSLQGLGDVYKQYNRYEEARQFYNRCKQIDPLFISSYHGLGSLFIKERKFNEAINEFKKALEIDSNRDDIKKELDWAMREKKRYELACLSSYDKSMHLSKEEIIKITKPRFCALGIVYRCNFRCKMCNIWENKGKKELGIQQWKDFLLAFKRVADNHCQINFAGGEPFLKEGLIELIRFAHDKGFITAVCTNAYLIDEKMAINIGGSGLNTIALSLDSLNAEKHDFLRGVKGSYDKVMNAIDLLSKYAPKTELNLLTIILQENLENLIPIMEWAQSNDKVNMINFLGLIQPRGNKKEKKWYTRTNNRILWPHDIGKLNNVIDNLIDMKNKGFFKIGNSVSQLLNYKKYYKNPDEYIHKHIKCNMGYIFLSVNEKGYATLCEERDPIGNILEQDIYDIWFSEKADKVREQIMDCKRNCHQLINCCYEEEIHY